jgi:hypothetical protein
MKFEISFRDIVEGNSEEEVYEDLLRYLAECVKNQDVSAFSIEQQEWKCLVNVHSNDIRDSNHSV